MSAYMHMHRVYVCVNIVLKLKCLLFDKQVSNVVLKELGSHPKVFIWDGEGTIYGDYNF